MVSYLHEDDLHAAQRASDDEGMALIEAHRAWDARRKVLLETVLWMQGRGLHQIASEMWDDLIGEEPTDG